MPEDKEAPVYTAERILLKRVQKGKVEYFIKWKGWAAKWNTWEPEKHILDKLLIEDYNNRNRKQQKSKSLVRHRVTKRQSTSKTRPMTNAPRTRRLQSSSSSDISTSALASPVTNDENNDEESFSPTKLDSDRTDSYKLRSKQSDKLESNSSEHDDDPPPPPPPQSIPLEQESLKEYLWQPTKLVNTSTTITEVTDQTGVTVLIRQLNEVPTPNTPRSTRVLGYGSAGRGGKH